MRHNDFQQPVTVKLVGQAGKEILCSAVLERDPGYLAWNRISILGNEDEQYRISRLNCNGILAWSLFENENWAINNSRDFSSLTSGRGILRSLGITSGVNIAEDSIQKLADIEIIDYCEEWHSQSENYGDLSAEYQFLQRPPGWAYHFQTFNRNPKFNTFGKWVDIPKSTIRLRLGSIGHLKSDMRISQETEIINIPSIGFKSKCPMSPEHFQNETDLLWFNFQILIAFQFRQHVTLLLKYHSSPRVQKTSWQCIALQAPVLRPFGNGAPHTGATEQFFARGSAKLYEYQTQREQLHAAMFGFVNSFRDSSLESGLTSVVEAIEGLVSAFDQAHQLNRELIGPAEWRRISKRLKCIIDGEQLEAEVSDHVKRWLSTPARLSLAGRICRMVEKQGKPWSNTDQLFLNGLDGMIKMRNDIVHGRSGLDTKKVYVELHRAQGIFERLFLNLLGQFDAALDQQAYLVIISA